MKTLWYTDYLDSESWDTEKFKDHGLNENEIFFSWWLTGDIQRCTYSINKILDLINNAKEGKSGSFCGNSCSAEFTATTVTIIKDRTKQNFSYSINEVEQALLKWKDIANV